MSKHWFRTAAGAVIWLAFAWPSVAQQSRDSNLSTDQAIPSLMFFTLGAVLLIAVGAFVYFLRKRSNREATERALGMDETRP